MVLRLWRWLRAIIYDWAIVWFTASWYRLVLEALPDNSAVLDVGVGTGAALVANTDLIRRKHLHIVGIDIDGDYIERARKLVRKAHLADRVHVRARRVEMRALDDRPPAAHAPPPVRSGRPRPRGSARCRAPRPFSVVADSPAVGL